MWNWFCAALVLLTFAGPAASQDLNLSQTTQPVLVIDPSRLFAESAYAAQLGQEVEQFAVSIQQENQRIVDELVAEERSLTERRPTMAPDEFRAEAQAFDEKAQQIRSDRDAKELELEDARRDVRDTFLADVRTVLGEVMTERGATIVMDSRSVYIALTSADITDVVIARVDAKFMNDAE